MVFAPCLPLPRPKDNIPLCTRFLSRHFVSWGKLKQSRKGKQGGLQTFDPGRDCFITLNHFQVCWNLFRQKPIDQRDVYDMMDTCERVFKAEFAYSSSVCECASSGGTCVGGWMEFAYLNIHSQSRPLRHPPLPSGGSGGRRERTLF